MNNACTNIKKKILIKMMFIIATNIFFLQHVISWISPLYTQDKCPLSKRPILILFDRQLTDKRVFNIWLRFYYYSQCWKNGLCYGFSLRFKECLIHFGWIFLVCVFCTLLVKHLDMSSNNSGPPEPKVLPLPKQKLL